MTANLKEFWGRLQGSVEVAVSSRDSETLLGVRDGFRRYFWQGLAREVAVLVHPGGDLASSQSSLWTSADESLAAAARAARALEKGAPDMGSFWVGAEEGLVSLEVDGLSHNFVHCWTVVRSEIGTACGGSGPIEIPVRLTEGVDPAHPERIPTTRRHGGMVGSLMGGLESRRDAFETATVHALATLFFGLVEPRPGPWRSGV